MWHYIRELISIVKWNSVFSLWHSGSSGPTNCNSQVQKTKRQRFIRRSRENRTSVVFHHQDAEANIIKKNWDIHRMIPALNSWHYVMHQQFNIQQLYALPTLYLCVYVFIWEQTATCATYSINWLVFITEMKSVYSAVRTGSLNQAVCALSVKG